MSRWTRKFYRHFDPDQIKAETLTAQDTGSWADATTFSITYDVADADFDTDTVSVDVEGAFDVAGNPMTDYTADVEFGIDTAGTQR